MGNSTSWKGPMRGRICTTVAIGALTAAATFGVASNRAVGHSYTGTLTGDSIRVEDTLGFGKLPKLPQYLTQYLRAGIDVKEPALHSIAEAEAEGARHATSAPPDSLPISFRGPRSRRDGTLAEASTSERKCVETKGSDVARSGEWVAGPFEQHPNIWHQSLGKIWWVPLHKGAGVSSTLVVRATRLDGPAPKLAYEVEERTRSENGDEFFPSGIRVPTVGRWMLVATNGPNWGCFLMDLK
jgi:hypothetical protein